MSGGRGARMINVASRPFYQMADRLLGSQFLQDIAEFFLNFQSMYAGFETRARAVEQLLHDRRTSFAVVTTLEGAPLREAQRFCSELAARDFHLGALVLNKTLPDYLLAPEGGRGRRRRAASRRRCARERARRDGRTRARRSHEHRAGAAHPCRLVSQLRSGGATRARAARRARASPRRGGRGAEPRGPTLPTWPAWRGSASTSSGTPQPARPSPIPSHPDDVLRAGARQDVAVGRVVAPRATTGVVVAAPRRPVLLRPPVARAGRGRRRRPLRRPRPGSPHHRPDPLSEGSARDRRVRSRAARRGGRRFVPGRSSRARPRCSSRPTTPTCSASRYGMRGRSWRWSPVRPARRSGASSASSSSTTSPRSIGSPCMIAEGSFPFRQDDDEFEDAPASVTA